MIALRHFLSCAFNLIASEHRRFTKRAHPSCFIRSDCPIKGNICSVYMLQCLFRTWRAREVLTSAPFSLLDFISFLQRSCNWTKRQEEMKSAILSVALLLFLNLGIRAVDNFFFNLYISLHIFIRCTWVPLGVIDNLVFTVFGLRLLRYDEDAFL